MLDADTGNETDDVYAIVRLLQDTFVNFVGLSSAHFNNSRPTDFKKWNQYETKNIRTIKISQRLNEEILTLTGRTYITHPGSRPADRQGLRWFSTKKFDSRQATDSNRKSASAR